jgi:ABC-2 type transport system ATP-binding protein
MKVSEIVNFCRDTCPAWDMKVVGRYLDLFGLPVGKKVRELSRGMKNQLALTLALGSGPDLLILDEPTGGMDPLKIRDFFRTILEQVAETGQTVFFSSHQLHEVERGADTVGIIHQGKLVFHKSLDEIKASLKTIRVVFEAETDLAELANRPGIAALARQGRGWIIECDKSLDEIKVTLAELSPVDLEVIDVSLEDVFLRYTGGGENG